MFIQKSSFSPIKAFWFDDCVVCYSVYLFVFREGVLRNCPIQSNAPISRNIVLITNLVVYAELLAWHLDNRNIGTT